MLNDRRILVTAGPTWVPIDAVRHIGNFSSGRTGLEIARAAAARGAGVTLLMGPGRVCLTDDDRAAMRVVDLITFDDMHAAVREQVGSRSYDTMIHTAAVSDFRPVSEERGKLSSGLEELVIRLRPTPKIVDEVKELDPGILLVKFKLEVDRSPGELEAIARASRERSRAELIVANDLSALAPGRHPALIMDETGVLHRVENTAELAARLLDEIERRRAEGARLPGSERMV
jgi:phosphopantothenoylcysteine synthetase/decarboxylase